MSTPASPQTPRNRWAAVRRTGAGRLALVTGASRGIGAIVAEQLAGAGYRVGTRPEVARSRLWLCFPGVSFVTGTVQLAGTPVSVLTPEELMDTTTHPHGHRGPVLTAASVIENPLSGERIRILTRPSDPSTGPLAWELQLAVGGRVPAPHRHPRQSERFTVLQGRLWVRSGWRLTVAGPGQSLVVPAGRSHSFTNRGDRAARVLVHTTPALRMEALLVTAAAMAQDQHAAGRRIPRLWDLVLFMDEFEAEAGTPVLPGRGVRSVIRPLAALGVMVGADAHYRRLKAGVGHHD